ncbi:hypothetical protein ACJX0J_037910, partial [Zea mays]
FYITNTLCYIQAATGKETKYVAFIILLGGATTCWSLWLHMNDILSSLFNWSNFKHPFTWAIFFWSVILSVWVGLIFDNLIAIWG